MADPGSGRHRDPDSPGARSDLVEVNPNQVSRIGCGVCHVWNRARLETREGVQRCHFCGFPLWALASVLERVGGDFMRLWH